MFRYILGRGKSLQDIQLQTTALLVWMKNQGLDEPAASVRRYLCPQYKDVPLANMRLQIQSRSWLCYVSLAGAMLSSGASALLNAAETPQELILFNDRLYASVNKSTGAV
jgi:hypothetical protein